MDPKVVFKQYTQDFYAQFFDRIKNKAQEGYKCEMECYKPGSYLENAESCAEKCKSLHIPQRKEIETNFKSTFV